MVIVFVYFQLVIVLVWAVFEPPSAEKVMAMPGQQDILCVFPTGPFVTSLAFNLTLLVVCAVFALLNRKLPENFNESKFIIICVYSTVVLWLAFIPAYFLIMSIYRILFLSLVLIINGLMIMGGLFLPKVYAVYFVKAGDMHVYDWRWSKNRDSREPPEPVSQATTHNPKPRSRTTSIRPV